MPKVIDHEARRQEILARCYTLFAVEGYAGVTLRRLAKALGVSTGAIYHYFDSKEDIFAQTIVYIAQRELNAAVEEIAPGRDRDARLASLTRFLLAHDENLRLILLLIFDASRQDPTLAQSDIFHLALDTYVDAMAKYFPSVHREDVRFAVDMLLGVVVRRLLVRRNEDFTAHIRWLVALVDGAQDSADAVDAATKP